MKKLISALSAIKRNTFKKPETETGFYNHSELESFKNLYNRQTAIPPGYIR